MVYGSYNVFSPKDGPFGVAAISESFGGNNPKNIPEGA